MNRTLAMIALATLIAATPAQAQDRGLAGDVDQLRAENAVLKTELRRIKMVVDGVESRLEQASHPATELKVGVVDLGVLFKAYQRKDMMEKAINEERMRMKAQLGLRRTALKRRGGAPREGTAAHSRWLQAAAEVKKAEATLAGDEVVAAHAEQLSRNGLDGKMISEQAKTKVLAAQAELERARARLAEFEQDERVAEFEAERKILQDILKKQVDEQALRILHELETTVSVYAREHRYTLIFKVDRQGGKGPFTEQIFRAQIGDVVYSHQAIDCTAGVLELLNSEETLEQFADDLGWVLDLLSRLGAALGSYRIVGKDLELEIEMGGSDLSAVARLREAFETDPVVSRRFDELNGYSVSIKPEPERMEFKLRLTGWKK